MVERAQFLLQNRYLVVGVLLFAAICLVALLAPWIVEIHLGPGVDPMSVGNFDIFQPPSPTNPLGTDRFGRDELALLLMGIRFSLTIGLLAGVIATTFGSSVGLIAGYYGGKVDNVLRTMTDMFLVIPSLPLLLTLSAYVARIDIPTMAVLLAVFSWPFAARTIRAQVLSLRERAYIDLARASGLSNLEIVFQEIMPNLFPYLGVSLAGSVIGAILAEFGLEVIGLGPGNVATLGLMINWAIAWGSMSLGAWVLIFAPAVTLVLIFLALNLINIGLEQTFNPRLKGTTGQ